jgi:hypothetical protein
VLNGVFVGESCWFRGQTIYLLNVFEVLPIELDLKDGSWNVKDELVDVVRHS